MIADILSVAGFVLGIFNLVLMYQAGMFHEIECALERLMEWLRLLAGRLRRREP